MALVQINNTVNSTATRLFTLPAGCPYTAVRVANGHSSSIFLGATSAVTTTGANHGETLAANTSVQIWMHGGDSLWAISSIGTGTGDVTVTYSGI